MSRSLIVGFPFKLLNTPSPDYQGPLLDELHLLYEGGYKLLAQAGRFFPRHPNESQILYEERIRNIGILGYLPETVDSFTSNVFTSPLALAPAADAADAGTTGTLPADEGYYKALQQDVDLRGTPLSALLRDVLTEALLCRTAYVLIDAPADNAPEPPGSLAEEDARGTSRAYVVPIPSSAIIAWSKDDRGHFEWATIKRTIPVRKSPFDPPGQQRIEFKVWERSSTGVVTWKLFATPVHRTDNPPKDTDDVPLVAEGVVSFLEIPIIPMEVPNGLWLGNLIGSICKELLSRRSALVSAMQRSLFAIPAAFLGPEMSASGDALPSDTQQNPNRAGAGPRRAFEAQGWMALGKDDRLEFVEPNGAAYEITAKSLADLVDELHRVTHRMAASVSSTSTALGRSGDSKALDKSATDIVVDALAGIVKAFAKRVFDTISEARGESVVWDAQGLDRTEFADRGQLVTEALAVDNINIPSPTFIKTYKTKLAVALLPKIDPQTANVIRDEIADAIDSAPDHPAPDGDEEPDDDDEEEPEDKDGPPSKGADDEAS